uniref:Uncharacterized protein n=1 Tax=Rhizophora mucronata TaxID=61149 RepID=A0A2P2NDW6_RHIMU
MKKSERRKKRKGQRQAS